MAAPTPESTAIVDASRPFRSVKEAVAIFGERILPRETHSPLKNPSVSFEKEIIHTASQNTSPISLETKKIPELQRPIVGTAYVEAEKIKKIPSQKQPNVGTVNVEPVNVKKITLTPQQQSSVDTAYVEFEEIKKIPHSSEIAPPSPSNSPNMYTNSYLIPHSPQEITQSPNESPSIVGKEMVKSSSSTNEPTPTPQTLDLMNPNHGNVVHGNDLVMMLMVLKKLEAEVQDTKMELRLLKERESETEVALATLNAKLHKNMSNIAKAEAAEARKAANTEKPKALLEGVRRSWEITSTKEEDPDPEPEERSGMQRGSSDMIVRNMDSPTLAKILSMTNYDGYFRDGKKGKNKAMKKKPIIPLVTDICPWRKRSSSSSSSSPHHDISGSLFSSHLYF